MKVAWISFFPIEGLPDLPPLLQRLPRLHPATWQRVLLEELRHDKGLELHILVVRSSFRRHDTFHRQGVTFHCLKVPKASRLTSAFWWETILIHRCLNPL